MTILHVAAGNLFGGIETCLIEFARAQKLEAGLRQEFAVCFEGRLSAELQWATPERACIFWEACAREPAVDGLEDPPRTKRAAARASL